MGSINALCLLRIVRKVGFGVVLSFEFETILKVAVSSRFRHDNAAGARLVFVRVFFLISTHQPSLATLSWEGGREGILHWASIDELSSERLLSWSIRSWNSGQWRGNEEEAQLTGVYYCRVLGCKQKGHPRSACNNSWGEHVQYNVLAHYCTIVLLPASGRQFSRVELIHSQSRKIFWIFTHSSRVILTMVKLENLRCLRKHAAAAPIDLLATACSCL